MTDENKTETAALALPKFAIKKAATVGAPKSILVYGPPKKGKTVFAASIVDVPGYERVLLVDVEGGSSSVSAWYPEVDVIEAGTHAEFTRVVEALLNGELVEPESGLPYQAVIIDTLDKAQERALEFFDKDPAGLVKGVKNEFYRWGALKTWTTKVTDFLHMAPFLTIFLAHQDDDKDEKTGAITTTVLLSGKSKYTFPSTPDIIGHFTVVSVKGEGDKPESKRVIDFSLSDKLITGQRYADALNGMVADPTFEKVFRKITPDIFPKN